MIGFVPPSTAQRDWQTPKPAPRIDPPTAPMPLTWRDVLAALATLIEHGESQDLDAIGYEAAGCDGLRHLSALERLRLNLGLESTADVLEWGAQTDRFTVVQSLRRAAGIVV